MGQFILTTHSTVLGSTIPLDKLIVVKDNNVFPMGSEHTKLSFSSYQFLERFMEATRANLFFAKGVIIVEGDAENLLIPTIAEIIGKPLHRYGVSIVNVGSTAFKRYADIFKRKDGSDFGVPVSIISDLDVRALEYYKAKDEDFPSGIADASDLEKARAAKKKEIEDANNEGEIHIYLPNQWTLEYEIACSKLQKYLFCAVYVAKREDNKKFRYEKALLEADKKWAELYGGETIEDDKQRAYDIFSELDDGKASKAATAQYLADMLSKQYQKEIGDNSENTIKYILEHDPYLQYIIDAIKHVTK